MKMIELARRRGKPQGELSAEIRDKLFPKRRCNACIGQAIHEELNSKSRHNNPFVTSLKISRSYKTLLPT
jgi:hypothetical protein